MDAEQEGLFLLKIFGFLSFFHLPNFLVLENHIILFHSFSFVVLPGCSRISFFVIDAEGLGRLIGET